VRARFVAFAWLLLGAAKRPEPPPEAPPLEGVRVDAVRFVVHARAVEVLEDLSVPVAALEREVFVSFPLVELPSAVDVSLVDGAGNEVCTDLPWRRLPQKVRTTALLHGAAHEAGFAFALRSCAALPIAERVTVRVRHAFPVDARAERFEWRRSLGQATVDPAPLRRLVLVRSAGAREVVDAKARFYRTPHEDDPRPELFVEGEMQNAEPTAADPALVRRTGADRLLVRLRFTP
jgi:hypothetical protein